MKTLEFYVGSDNSVAGLKPLTDRLAEELGDEWQYAFDADAKTARFTHGVMFFEIAPTQGRTTASIKCGNGKYVYTLNEAWAVTSNHYCYIDIIEADDRGTVVLGFRVEGTGQPSYGFNVIWGKYDDSSEYIVWGVINTGTSETPAALLDDTATVSRTFPGVLENIDAPWCFGKLPKTNLAVLPKSLYFGSSVPFRTHYIELLRGDKKFVGFAALKAGATNTVTSKPSMFAVPVDTFEVEHIKI